jgi:hypothetical protein
MSAPRRGPLPDDARLEAIVRTLAGDPRYATGARAFQGGLTDDEAAELAETLERDLDGGVAERAREAARLRLKIVCERGCNVCCEEPLIVYAPEALAVARWLASPANAEVREQFLAAYPRWAAARGDGALALAALAADDARRDDYEAQYRVEWGRRVMCAFNVDGACSIYAVRPLLCREGHALETNERCVVGATVPAKRLAGGPVEVFMQRASQILRGAHNALGEPRSRGDLLCAYVYRLLNEGRLAE